MPRRSREDGPGALHHVYNRGIARRTVFEQREDVRFFLSRLARVHRMGILEIHGFCFLTNHFHLILGSPTGELSRAVQLTVNPFVRWFNRGRRRDGPLFRGRFGSRRVRSMAYLVRLVPYVDQNSVRARLVSDSELYPYGSARFFQEARGPKWHTRDLIEDLACTLTGRARFHPGLYRSAFGAELTPAESEWLELRIRAARDGPDPLDDLVGASTPRVQEWMARRAELADGERPGLALAAPSVVVEVLRERQALEPDLRFSFRGKASAAWTPLMAGLLREACSLTIAATARTIERAASTVSDSVRAHRELLLAKPAYATLAAELLTETLDRMHGRVLACPGGPLRSIS